jgi:DNA-binding CsgD family transcriptional regulator
MQALHKELAAAKSNAQKGIMQRQIRATDREIDQLVYQIYGLTNQEIALIEDAASEAKAPMSEAGG